MLDEGEYGDVPNGPAEEVDERVKDPGVVGLGGGGPRLGLFGLGRHGSKPSAEISFAICYFSSSPSLSGRGPSALIPSMPAIDIDVCTEDVKGRGLTARAGSLNT